MDEINGIPFLPGASTNSLFQGFTFTPVAPNAFPAQTPVQDTPFNECDGTCEHRAEFFRESIDFKKLSAYLTMYFNLDRKFIAGNFVWGQTPGGLSADAPVLMNAPSSAGIKYRNSSGKIVEASYTGKLNKVHCCVATVLLPGILIEKGKIAYFMQWYYKGCDDLISVKGNKLYIDEEYIAAEVVSSSYEDIIAFIRANGLQSSPYTGYAEPYKQAIIKEFSQAVAKNKDDMAS